MATTKITWLGHSTFLIDVGDGPAILIDPWFDGNPKYPRGYELDRVDLLLITHMGTPTTSATC